MKFIADVMLGKLAKRMRLLGFDVLYDRTLDDNEIIRLSLEQKRIILTRDTELAGRPLAANRVFIRHDAVKDQLRQVIDALMIESAPGPLTRCSLCNDTLLPITKQDIKDLIPNYVYVNYDGFLRCISCGRIYWEGTHVRNMRLSG
ncbi:MAG TPA: Mut7-C RNAse domain-containing protein [Nitrospirota bacterium]|nr:Mut7-C RNAse domain-containing protein [Nitrospirota bacterium]